MTNTYTMTTDDASCARAMIAILDCLHEQDIADSYAIEAIMHLIEMCLNYPLDNIDYSSAILYAKFFKNKSDEILAYAATQEEQ